ncbi:Uma2 family endonuclease [Longispora albida]|uniref:Uma2 family endonuclease n=1 Tax=Longispora albida TaxID=203523 RepID=UPI00035F2930|nr:Uma2 family endonuclease [Longispora albida]
MTTGWTAALAADVRDAQTLRRILADPTNPEVYPDSIPHELLNGAIIVTPPAGPTHGSLMHILGSHLRRQLPRPLWLGIDTWLYLDRQNHPAPDLMLCQRPDSEMKRPTEALLVLEILSPATADRDRGEKKSVYARHGIPSYLIVDPEPLTVTEYRLAGDTYTEQQTVTAPGIFTTDTPCPLTINLGSLARELADW